MRFRLTAGHLPRERVMRKDGGRGELWDEGSDSGFRPEEGPQRATRSGAARTHPAPLRAPVSE